MNLEILYIIFFSVILVGITADFFQKKISFLNKFVIPFGIAFILSLIFIHILPELYESQNHLVGLFFVIGFALQIVLELLSKGIEHGHVHAPKNHTGIKLILPLMLGLCLHSFIEGMPLISTESTIGHAHHHNHTNEIGEVYFTMILVHKLPIAAILMFFLIQHIKSIWNRYALLLLFALTAPLGAVFGFYLSEKSEIAELSTLLLALSTGMLIHIATLLVFEKYHNPQQKWITIGLIIGGLFLGVIIYS